MKDRYRYCYRVVRGECCLSSVVGRHLCAFSLRTRCVSCHSVVSCSRDHLSFIKRSHHSYHTLRHGARYGARRRHARQITAERQPAGRACVAWRPGPVRAGWPADKCRLVAHDHGARNLLNLNDNFCGLCILNHFEKDCFLAALV